MPRVMIRVSYSSRTASSHASSNRIITIQHVLDPRQDSQDHHSHLRQLYRHLQRQQQRPLGRPRSQQWRRPPWRHWRILRSRKNKPMNQTITTRTSQRGLRSCTRIYKRFIEHVSDRNYSYQRQSDCGGGWPRNSSSAYYSTISGSLFMFLWVCSCLELTNWTSE